jgi:hypothetical protein
MLGSADQGGFSKSKTFNRASRELGNGFCSTNGLETLEVRQFSLGTIIAAHEEQCAGALRFQNRQSNMNLNLERVSDEAQ